MQIRRGEIYYADLSPVVGSEQGGTRPVLILQNDIGNQYSPTTIVAAITSQISKSQTTHPCGTTGRKRRVGQKFGNTFGTDTYH